ncbi:hypothetical protein Dip518_001083 [Parelusimicrobium proximum]|uniref:metallophosphoesterase n=1 Tax=Parelusimicrobium proximum TaxID=3228953 RepID=UPI003D17CCFF
MFLFALGLFVCVWCMNFILVRAIGVYIPVFANTWVLVILPLVLSVIFIGVYTAGKKKGIKEAIAIYDYWRAVLFLLFIFSVIVLGSYFILGVFDAPPPRYIGIIWLVLLATVIFISVHNAQREPMLREITLPIKDLPVDKLTIAHLADLHLGQRVNEKRAAKLVAQVNALKPDLILISGDIYENAAGTSKKFENIIKGFESKYGIYGTLGNHEYYEGVRRAVRFFRDSGITLLKQRIVEPIAGVQIMGIDDLIVRKMPDAKLRHWLSGLDPHKTSIVLQHSPVKLNIFAEKKVKLLLCGHTHNGQIFPLNILLKLKFRYVYGLHKVKKMFLYITSGTFYRGTPLRFMTRNELPFITLRREERNNSHRG